MCLAVPQLETDDHGRILGPTVPGYSEDLFKELTVEKPSDSCFKKDGTSAGVIKGAPHNAETFTSMQQMDTAYTHLKREAGNRLSWDAYWSLRHQQHHSGKVKTHVNGD